jgi:hypothetical protein
MLSEKSSATFSGWDRDAAKYGKVFERLQKGLQTENKK